MGFKTLPDGRSLLDVIINDAAGNTYANAQGFPVHLGELLAGEDQLNNRLLVTPKDTWYVADFGGAAGATTATKAAGATGVKHVVTEVHFGVQAVGAQVAITFILADGSGTIIRRWYVSALAAGAAFNLDVTGLWIVGPAATSMVLKSEANAAASNFLTATMVGVDIQ